MMFKAYGVDSVVITTQNILWVNYGSREGWSCMYQYDVDSQAF